MSAGFKPPIRGDSRLLVRVPKNAIISRLLSEDIQADDLLHAYQTVSGGAGQVSPAALAALTQRDVIRVFERCPGMPTGEARRLYEEHRYRGMKVLYLYECDDLSTLRAPHLEQLNVGVADLEAAHQAAHQQFGFSGLEVVDWARVGTLHEFAYEYVASIPIVNPGTGYPEFAKDLRFGFIWIHPGEQWMAVCARDEAITDILSSALASHFQFRAKRLQIPKSVVQILEPLEYIRRASFVEPTTNTRRQISNPRLAEDEVAMTEIRRHDGRDDRPSSGYTVTLDDGTEFALGYSNQRGKIFLSRDLTVQQMRDWGPPKVAEIVGTVRDRRITNPGDFLLAAAPGVLSSVPARRREALLEIARAVWECRRSHASEADLGVDTVTLAQTLGHLVQHRYSVHCETCQEAIELRCASCERPSTIRLTDGALICSECAGAVSPAQVECSEGHHNTVGSLAGLVQLFPTDSLGRLVAELIEEATGEQINREEELFFLRGSRLVFSLASAKIVYRLHEVPELARLLASGPVPQEHADAIAGELAQFREKYSSCMSTANCAECPQNRHHVRCFLRLFGLFDPEHTPRPHQGHEFGDYSRLVTLDGSPGKQLALAMKSGKPGAAEIALRDKQKKGQDIHSQVAGYLRQAGVDIVGICAPQRLEPGFVAMLRHESGLLGKKLLLLDDKDLVRIVWASQQRHGLDLHDI
jgi:hypothetical protein